MTDLFPRNPRISPVTPDETVARIAAQQHGVVRLAQLRWAGIHHDGITRRVNDRRLHRVYQGVYAVGHTGLSPAGELLAAAFACGDGAAVSHLRCAELWKVSRFPLPALIDVVVPRERNPGGKVRAHQSRTLRRSDITLVNRIPVTRVPRMLVDLAETLTAHQLAYVIHQAAYRDLFDLRATREALARSGGRRTTPLKRAIELYLSGSAGTRSKAEDEFLAHFARDEPRVNTPLLGEEVDFHWPARRLVVEIDGPGHGRAPTRRADARRDAKLAAAGYTVLRFGTAQVEDGTAVYATLGSSSWAVRGGARPAAA